VRLHHEYLSSQAGELTIVGDFDPDACLPILQRALAGWTSTKPYARISTAVAGLSGSQHNINTPDKANATYTSGLLFPIRDDDPDYPALLMGNYILGAGSLSSRLGTRVRQQEGLSYGISSSLSVSSFDKRAGLTITAICNPQNIGRVEKAVREEIERLLKDGVTTEELDKAKQGYLQSQKVTRSSDTALAGTLSNFRHLDRTMFYQAELEQKIDALTSGQ